MVTCRNRGFCSVSVKTLARFGALLVMTAVLGSGCPVNEPAFQDTFNVDKANLQSTGANPYFIPLDPGHRRIYQDEAGLTLTITTLDETKLVDGVVTRVIEEREEANGELVEVSRNYFAMDRTTNGLYYLGEDVDEYTNGQVTGHPGAWLSGVNGARFGLMMPGQPAVGDRYYQEVAPGVALDRAEVISVTEQVQTPAGTFTNCVHTEETTPLESGITEKWYAPGVGMIRDGDLVLTSVENP